MKKQKGFTLIELLIVIVIIGIIAAIAIPGLLRARANANESGSIGDTRTVISASATYAASNGQFYDKQITCYMSPTGANCIPNYKASILTFLDSKIGSANAVTKSGYSRIYTGGSAPAASEIDTNNSSPGSVIDYTYGSEPLSFRTGARMFCGDSSGIICVAQWNGTPGNYTSLCTAGGPVNNQCAPGAVLQ